MTKLSVLYPALTLVHWRGEAAQLPKAPQERVRLLLERTVERSAAVPGAVTDGEESLSSHEKVTFISSPTFKRVSPALH